MAETAWDRGSVAMDVMQSEPSVHPSSKSPDHRVARGIEFHLDVRGGRVPPRGHQAMVAATVPTNLHLRPVTTVQASGFSDSDRPLLVPSPQALPPASSAPAGPGMAPPLPALGRPLPTGH